MVGENPNLSNSVQQVEKRPNHWFFWYLKKQIFGKNLIFLALYSDTRDQVEVNGEVIFTVRPFIAC